MNAFEKLAKEAEMISSNSSAYHSNDTNFTLSNIEHQTEDECLEAVRNNGLELKYVKEQTPYICLEAVRQNGLALQYVREQSNCICLEAVKQNANAIKFVKRVTGFVLDVASRKDSNVVSKYIRDFEYCDFSEYYGEANSILVHNYSENPDDIFSGMSDEHVKAIIANSPHLIKNVKNQTEELCRLAVESNVYSYMFVNDPTDELTLDAVSCCGYLLQYAKNQTPEICKAAVRSYGLAIEFVKDVTEDIIIEAAKRDFRILSRYSSVCGNIPNIYMEAVKSNGLAIQLVKEQTPELCLAAVKRCGTALKCIKEQTPEICTAAVKKDYTDTQRYDDYKFDEYMTKQGLFEYWFLESDVQDENDCIRWLCNGGELAVINNRTPELCAFSLKFDTRNLMYIDNQTPELCLAAVSKNGLALEYVKEQTHEICLAAVKNNSSALKYVINKTEDIRIAAKYSSEQDDGVNIRLLDEQGDWRSLKDIRHQTPELCLKAIRRNGLALQFVKDQTPEICLVAVERDGLALQFVKEQTPEICAIAIKENPMAIKYAMVDISEDLLFKATVQDNLYMNFKYSSHIS